MSTSIVRKEITPEIWGMIERIAPTMKDSRLFGVATVHQAAAIMLKGHELGLGMAASFEFVQVIQDKPTLNPRGALALIMQSGECAGISIEDQSDDKGNPTACKVTMKRKNGVEYTTSFTMEDAKRAGLIKPESGWAKYPANMLRWRSIGYAADIVFPDIIGGMKRADEFDAAISPEGDVIATTWTVKEPTQPAAKQTQVQTSLQDLINEYGPDAVLAACGNKLPGTDAEVAEVAAKLGGE